CTQHLPFAHDSGQTLGLDVPDEPLQVPGQAELLRLALRNLVDNALRHNPRGTQVEIAVQQQPNGTITLSVSDDGHFDPQGSSRPGMGVGLTLVRRIAHAMGVGFQHEPGRTPYRTRFVLSWPPVGRKD
ncbi:MAG: ATP-binding protein, partial [Burkholderiaceae bacterium]|nr:ATP-binding protein [Burkholderiaceae bacterium]